MVENCIAADLYMFSVRRRIWVSASIVIMEPYFDRQS